ncbi:hypothetical protein [Streptomyces sp. NPDC012888]|uniref:hypothetical protein n=1 Tax=Streptomyces sp. NPDC012888 TaxID=3364855 RepID=UPI003684B821
MTANVILGWLIVSILVGALWVLWRLGAGQSPPDQQEWDASTGTRTEADIRRDIAAYRARQAAIQQYFDADFSRIIAAEYPDGIPSQRRKEQP